VQAALISVTTWLATQAEQAPEEAGGLGGLSPLVMIVLMFGVFYFLMIRPQSKQQKEHQSFVSTLQKGAEVVTSGGILGKVHAVAGDSITLEVAKDVRIQIMKNYVYPARGNVAGRDARDVKDSKEPKDSKEVKDGGPKDGTPKDGAQKDADNKK
jgi:preprotein translocase subunit YajC